MQPPRPSRIIGVLLLLTSLSCIGIVTLSVAWAAALTPGYSHVSQLISELGAMGAPYEMWVRLAGFLPAGLLLLAFSALSSTALPRSRSVALGLSGLALFAAGYLVASAFPCDPGCRPAEPSMSQLIHNAGSFPGYLAAPISLFVLARAARRWPGADRLGVAGYAASAVALAGLVTLSSSSDIVGLSQRALELAVLVWVAMLGVYLARRSADSD